MEKKGVDNSETQLKLKKEKLARYRKEKELKDEAKRREEEMKKKEQLDANANEINRIIESSNREKKIKEEYENQEKSKLLVQLSQSPIRRKSNSSSNFTLATFVGEFHEEPKISIFSEIYEREVQVDLISPDTQPEDLISSKILDKEEVQRKSSRKNIQKINENGSELQDLIESKNIAETKEHKNNKDIFQIESKEKSSKMGENDVKGILSSEVFLNFFDRSSKLIEKIIENGRDDVPVYFTNFENEEDTKDKQKSILNLYADFENSETKGKPVLSIEWSKNQKDLFVATYAKKENLPIIEREGEAIIWSTHLKKRAEEILLCQSEVMTASFDPYSVNEILGGTSAGYVVIWDVRAKPNPVQRSTLSLDINSGPIFYISAKSTHNSNYIYTVSTNGKFFLWNKSNLSYPVKILSYIYNTNEIGPISIAIQESEQNCYFLGCDDSKIYLTDILESEDKIQNVKIAFEGHEGPVTSLSLNCQSQLIKGTEDQLLLSSSIDWKIKLWNLKKSKEALVTFENSNNYILDVEWNPVNPTIFSSCDADGNIDLWNIADDIEKPMYRLRPKEYCINKLKWNSEGKKMACGDINGSISIISADKEVYNAKPEDIEKMEELIYEKKKAE